jgi:hypothetical protein
VGRPVSSRRGTLATAVVWLIMMLTLGVLAQGRSANWAFPR